ncbi:PKD domain-containing protein [Mucilaginibacter roseus]|uniref:PKD domain-containing protein n=1 Tax=Mucilaginibacter roseus TaxID=1528868 RepID=A0ABS8TYY0_9SPHI|nr:PKD domain-containing protein [Mucilaginibacter roseus]MCD8740074.1 PKD domain-containing protein [Mucilaginibacter roseus]
MRAHYLAILLWFLLLCTLTAGAQSYTTSKGTKFWVAYTEHISATSTRASDSRMVLYIASDVSTSGKVSVADGGFSTNFTVPANGVAEVEIPAYAQLIGTGTKLKGIYVEAKNPVAVYAHIFALSVSGATLVLPVNTLGKDYYTINYTQKSNSLDKNQDETVSYSQFAVIATDDNTTVEITPSQALRDGNAALTPFSKKLKKGEVYQGQSLMDLTGTRIRSVSANNDPCKKIAVFAGSTKLAIGCDTSNFSSDNVIQQVFPTASWGKNYITAPLKGRDYDVFRVVLSDNNTNVTLNGTLMNRLPAGVNFIEFTSRQPNLIKADKPVQVVQYAVTQTQTLNCIKSNEVNGDPEMIYLSPLEQTLDNVTLFSAKNFSIRANFINVVIKSADVSSFILDGRPYNTFSAVPGDASYSYAQISVQSGVHNLSAKGGFSAIAYGFGQFESYGYAAGANLDNLNERIVLTPPGGAGDFLAGCANVDYSLQLALPYLTNTIKWVLHDSTEVVQNNPAYTTAAVNGGMVYYYKFPNIVNYRAGDYLVKAIVNPQQVDDCGSTRDVEFSFNISDPPVARFAVQNVCLKNEMLFADSSRARGSTIKTWYWEFGDGNGSYEQSPAHLYATPGNYDVKLTITNNNGCTDVAVKNVTVYPPPVADFNYAGRLCSAGDTVRLNGTSPTLADIDEWQVDFGDGTAPVSFTNNKPYHQYATGGTYVVSLRVRSKSTGCYSNPVSHTLTVNTAPVINFNVPDVCIADMAVFENNTLLADGTAGQITYSWNFGDPASGSANTSSAKNGAHHYTRAGVYNVTLTAAAGNGCLVTKTATISVNGNNFSGGILLENQANLCVAQPVVFVNNARVNQGEIIKVEWYFDVLNKPGEKLTLTKANMPADGKISHLYDPFSFPASKYFKVRMVVYSGLKCSEQYETDIVVYAQPGITINSSAGFVLCEDSAPVQFIADANGVNGTGTFSGQGIGPDGTFVAANARPGINTLTYTFRSDKGCDVVKTFDVTVSKLPVVKVPAVVNVFNGRGKQPGLSASGEALTFKWSPSDGLSRDDVLNPGITLNSDMTYRLTVTSGACSVMSMVNVKVHRQLTIPNTFTPNGDGINDTWNIDLLQSFPDCVVTVVNRNGARVFSSTGYTSAWNGTMNGSMLPAGTYYYTIDLKDGSKPYSGYLTLLR